MRNLKQRSYEPELMDEDGISFEEFHNCLHDLEIINILSLGYRPTLRWLKKMIVGQHQTIHILDVGSGGGDVLRKIEKFARRTTLAVKLTGVDLNPWSKQSAKKSRIDSSIQYETADIFSFETKETIDIVICSLFTHHLDDDQLVNFLRWMDSRAAQGWFINDLHRHALPYYFIKLATKIFSRNRLIQHDAALSIAKAFTVTDWRHLLEKAGIAKRAHVQWFFPFRLCVSCRKI